ncbi:kelch repeat-containing protein [Cnuella takakiae]|nr:kelch repeat-containing protein [Cnuella takakiae]OLY93247.1 hypothetical protein BUE76_16155 [Cnuella takakiae]
MKYNRYPLQVLMAFFFVSVTQSTTAQWKRSANALQTRSEASSVVYEGKYYVFMGFGTPELEPATNSEVYDPVLDEWKLLQSIPDGKAVTHQGVARLDSRVWHIGGRRGNHPGPLTNEIWIYDISTDSWSQGPSILDPATGNPLLWGAGGAVFLGRTLHVFGGFVATACDADQSTYHLTLDVDAWLANPGAPAPWKNEKAPMPLKRNHFGTVILNGKIYAIGGQTGHDCRGGQDKRWSHVYDPATDSWQRLPDMPQARSHVEGSSFAVDGKIYVLGGQVEGSINTKLATVFDPSANNGAGGWYNDSTLQLPSAYEGPAAKVIGSALLFSHGGEGSSRRPRKAIFTQSIARNPNYRFLLPAGCGSYNLLKGSVAQGQTLLFTADSSTAYTVSSTATWLKPTKGANGVAVVNGVDIGYTIDAANLEPGEYQASLDVTGEGFTSASYCISVKVSNDILEAESAVRSGAILDTLHPGYTSSGYVDYQHPTEDFIEWTIDVPEARSVVLKFRYANGSKANRPMQLTLNDSVLTAALDFPTTGSFNNWGYSDIPVSLVAGTNNIRLIASGASGPNVDHLALDSVTNLPVATMHIQADTSASRSMNIAPNPVMGTARVTLNWSPVHPVTVQVLDRSGALRRQMRFNQVANRQLLVPVETLPPATYILVVRESAFVVSRQIIIVR